MINLVGIIKTNAIKCSKLSAVYNNYFVVMIAGQKILVYEYVPNGSLLDYIVGMLHYSSSSSSFSTHTQVNNHLEANAAGKEGRTLTWRHRVEIAIGAAKGDDQY